MEQLFGSLFKELIKRQILDRENSKSSVQSCKDKHSSERDRIYVVSMITFVRHKDP